MLRRSLLSLSLAFVTLNLFAAEEPVKAPKDLAEPSPLTARLVAKEDTYTLSKDQQGEAFRAKLKDPKLREVFAPPAVDLVLELKNPTEKPITITVGSDAGALLLDLQGPGAVTASPPIIMTREFRMGKPVEIAAGATYEIPITKLSFGLRGVSMQAFWTEPGDYTLGATFRWPGADNTIYKAVAEPIKIVVKAAE